MTTVPGIATMPGISWRQVIMIRGHLRFDHPITLSAAKRIIISVEDTSLIDAASILVAQIFRTLPEGFDPEHDLFPFEIDVPGATDGLTVRAHLACHDGTDVRVGDMITTVSTPARRDREISMTLKRVD